VSTSSVSSRFQAGIGLRSAFVVAALLVLVAGCGGPPSVPPTAVVSPMGAAPPEVDRLLRLMRDRLALMHDVARAKWNAGRPVGDPEREQALLREMEGEGQERGLDPEFTRAFFTAQIAAARRMQEEDIAHWRAEGCGPFAGAPDLAALRRRIDVLNRDMLGALAEARPRLGDGMMRDQLQGWARETLAREGITDDVRTVAVAPLTSPQR
jgi:chorismate mutase